MKLNELAEKMADIRAKLDILKEEKATLEKEYDRLRLGEIPECMDAEGIGNITLEGIGRITLTSDVYASIPATMREDAYDWLDANGHGGIIKPTVNAGTLKALIKKMMKDGVQIPPELFKVTPYTRASITKVK